MSSNSNRDVDPSPSPAAELDPLLKDLKEKKQSFRQNLASLAAELKEVRARLASLERSCAREAFARQEAEAKSIKLEEEIRKLQARLEERDMRLRASASSAEKYLKELDDLRSQLAAAQATASASATSAQLAKQQCSELLKELDEKNSLLEEHENLLRRLEKMLNLLQSNDPRCITRTSQKQLRDEVLRIEHGIAQAIAKGGHTNKDCQNNKRLDEFPEQQSLLETVVVEVMAKLGDDIKLLSAYWTPGRTNNADGEFRMIWAFYSACGVLVRLMSLFFFLPILGMRLIYYMLIRLILLSLRLIFVGPLRICLFLLRTISMQNVVY